MNTHKIGIDIGSTTAKIVVLSHDGDIIYSRYERHQAAVYPLIYNPFLKRYPALTGDTFPAQFPSQEAWEWEWPNVAGCRLYKKLSQPQNS